jgi:hypothetical protein
MVSEYPGGAVGMKSNVEIPDGGGSSRNQSSFGARVRNN